MPKYQPSQIDDANLAYYYTSQQTQYGPYYRLNQAKEGFPSGFYASERTTAQPSSAASSAQPSSAASSAQPSSAASSAQPSSAASSTPNVELSIVIFRATPLDYQKYRHTSLCLRSSHEAKFTMIHIVGPNKGYQLETLNDYVPVRSARFAKQIVVGKTTTPLTKAQLAALIYQTPINNQDVEFNCQTWVQDALKRLADARYLTHRDYDRAVTGMVDATMEAKDEPQ